MTAEPRKFTKTSLILNAAATTLFFPALILLLAGNWRWVEGWIFSLWMAAMIVFNMTYLYFKDPSLLAERTKRPGSEKNEKSWDKLLLPAVLLLAVAWLILLPLDAERFHWSPAFPLWLKVIGGLALIPAFYLIEWTTMANTFLSTMVRIQEERKQHVVTTGTYGFVRHPLYMGCMMMMFGAPLLVGSVIGLILTAIGMAAIVVRILGEEKMMLVDLEGYGEYQKKVKYRLIPFVW